MDLGTAIKVIRKKKGISQKLLAEKSELSVNALGLIESNVSFPKKVTLEKISNYLGVPISHILFFAVDEKDVEEEKRATFTALKGVMQELLLS